MGSGIYSLGTRAMFASQAMLDTTANNISNVKTPGYSRQQVELATESGMYTGAGFFGRGVRIATVTRSTNEFLIKEAKMVFTDSGGVIKEAYYHRVPSIIIDKQTEWMEIINEGWSKIAGPDQLKILELKANFEVPKTQNMSLGQGNASEIIAGFIYEYLQHKG